MEKKASASIERDGRTGKFVLGRGRFEKISAVEGVKLSKAASERFDAMDKRGASAEERRRTIVAHHKKGA